MPNLHAIRMGKKFALPLLIVLMALLLTQPLSAQDDVIRQWAVFATGSSQYSEPAWSFMQATGPPDTGDCDDIQTAWASETSTGSDVLALEFAEAVIPTQVNIYQTFNPGSIIRVDLGNTNDSRVIQIPNSNDPPGNTPCPGVFTVDVAGADFPMDGVIIYFDQSIGGSWNEIDAVELVGRSTSAAVVPAVADKGEPASTANSQTITGNIAVGDEGVHPFTFSAGDVVTITVVGGTDFDPQVTLNDSNDSMLMFNDDHFSGDSALDFTDSRIADFVIPASGSYNVVVADFFGAGGSYELTVEVADDAPQSTASSETLNVSLQTGERFEHSATFNQDDVVTITARDTSNTLDPVVELLDNSAVMIAENDDHNSDDTTLDLFDSQITAFVIPVTGSYTIAVFDLLGDAGDLELTIETQSSADPKAVEIKDVPVVDTVPVAVAEPVGCLDPAAGDVATDLMLELDAMAIFEVSGISYSYPSAWTHTILADGIHELRIPEAPAIVVRLLDQNGLEANGITPATNATGLATLAQALYIEQRNLEFSSSNPDGQPGSAFGRYAISCEGETQVTMFQVVAGGDVVAIDARNDVGVLPAAISNLMTTIRGSFNLG